MHNHKPANDTITDFLIAIAIGTFWPFVIILLIRFGICHLFDKTKILWKERKESNSYYILMLIGLIIGAVFSIYGYYYPYG